MTPGPGSPSKDASKIIGEALIQLRDREPHLFASITSARQIVGVRNLLVHRYLNLDHRTVWPLIREDVPALQEELEAMRQRIEEECIVLHQAPRDGSIHLPKHQSVCRVDRATHAISGRGCLVEIQRASDRKTALLA